MPSFLNRLAEIPRAYMPIGKGGLEYESGTYQAPHALNLLRTALPCLPVSAAGRILRIIPAYGCGLYINDVIR